MKYEVVISRCGIVCVEADNPEEAMTIADNQRTEDIHWDDEWVVTDCHEDTETDIHEELYEYIKKEG